MLFGILFGSCFSHLNDKLFSFLSRMFFILVQKVPHKSDKLGPHRYISSAAKLIVTRTRIFKMYHFVIFWKCNKKILLYNIFDNQGFMCKLQNLFEKSLYKVLQIRKNRLLLQPLSRGKRAKAMTCW